MKAKNPKYTNQARSGIDLEYEHPVYGWIPFTAIADDVEQLGRELFQAALDGEFGEIADYVELEIPEEISISKIKSERDRLLSESDWTDTLSAKQRLGSKLYDEWQLYRQNLRDITKQPDYPKNVHWPKKP